jgi:hypothetical protein
MFGVPPAGFDTELCPCRAVVCGSLTYLCPTGPGSLELTAACVCRVGRVVGATWRLPSRGY